MTTAAAVHLPGMIFYLRKTSTTCQLFYNFLGIQEAINTSLSEGLSNDFHEKTPLWLPTYPVQGGGGVILPNHLDFTMIQNLVKCQKIVLKARMYITVGEIIGIVENTNQIILVI